LLSFKKVAIHSPISTAIKFDVLLIMITKQSYNWL